MAPRQTRRRLLLASGATLAGLAGCVTSGSPIGDDAEESACRITVETNEGADERPVEGNWQDVTDAADERSDERVTDYVDSVSVVREDGWAVLRVGVTGEALAVLSGLEVHETTIPFSDEQTYELSLGRLPYHGRINLTPISKGLTRLRRFVVRVEYNCAD